MIPRNQDDGAHMLIFSDRAVSAWDARFGRLHVAVIGLLFAPWVFAYPAHYFVINEAADGSLSVVSQHRVEISGTPQPSSSSSKPGRLESHITAVTRDKRTGIDAFNALAVSSPWLRGEFHGHDGDQIEGHHLALDERLYVVRVPVEAGQILRLNGTRSSEINATTAANRTTSAAANTPATLEIDLDQITLSALAVAEPQALPPGAARGVIYQNGTPANRLDVLIVAEGYTAAQQAQFVEQATTLANDFLLVSPYSDFRHLINVHWLFVPSNQSGADKPACAETPGSTVVVVDTAFDATFCSSGIRRLVTVSEAKVFAAAASVADWDQILVLVNDTEYGGSGGSLGVGTLHASSSAILQHEFGHSFTQLADEYDTPLPGSLACSDVTGSTPCEANVSDQTDRNLLKWRGWVAATTAIPTVAALADSRAAGLWQGAQYQSIGMYRQCFDGLMRSLSRRPSCYVDSEAFVKRLYGGGWGAPAAGVSLIDPDVSPLATTVNAAVGANVVFRATLAGSLSAAGLTATWLVNGNTARVVTSAHGTRETFTFQVPDTVAYTVELRVSDSTPATLVRPQRSRIWTVQGANASLTVSTQGTGTGTVTSTPAGINCGSACNVGYASPTQLTLTATPNAGSVFIGWLGACIGTGTCTITTNGATAVSATFAPSGLALRIDVDGNNSYHPLTDGVLLMRYLLGVSGAPLTAGALGTLPTRTAPLAIVDYLDNLAPLLDVDGNGKADALTDGVILLRYLFGLRGAPLIAGAVGVGATRSVFDQIETQIRVVAP